MPHERIILIGAGSTAFTQGLLSDLIRSKWDVELGLVDIDAAALSVTEAFAAKMIKAKGASIRLEASTDRRQVLKDATVVICTIAVGSRRGRESDVLIPRKYGIYQPVGDTVMPGGLSRALRMIPAMVDIAKDAADLSPQAIFINYSNPMTAVCRAIRKATDVNVIGLCHGVEHFAGDLADVLHVKRASLSFTAVGLNHLTWFTSVRTNGRDAMPKLRAIADAEIGQGSDLDHLDPQAGATFPPQNTDRFGALSWRLFKLFGAMPAPSDRHVVEFFPQFCGKGDYYGRTLGVDAFAFEPVIEQAEKQFAKMVEAAESTEPLGEHVFEHALGEQEQVVDIIEAIRTDTPHVFNANLPNTGQMPNLPSQAILEGPVVTSAQGLHPIAQHPMPAGVVGLQTTHLACVETIVEAALTGSRDKFIQALILDGATRSFETASRLADELLAAHQSDLPQFNW